jgi:PmbA protein
MATNKFNTSDLRDLAERVLKIAKANGLDGAEVDAGANVDALTRFANNTIHQNVAEETLAISFRAIINGRTARATTNKTDDESLRRVVEAATSLAKNQPKNPDLLPLLGKQKYQKVSRFFSSTANTTPQDRAKAVAKVCKHAAKHKQTAAGIFVSGSSQSILANSKGLFAHYEQTRAEFSITILESDSSGWAKANSPDIRKIDPVEQAESASEKAAKSRKPQELAPGHYVTILEPAAVLDLMGFLFFDFSGTALEDKRSCLTGRMGQKLFGENITVWDDAYHPLQTGFPFDGEGEPRQKVLLIDRGVAKNVVYARATAKRMNTKPTGHGFSLPNDIGEAPMNIVFAGGNKSVDDMIRSTERGVLVTRLWYIREVDPFSKIVTGMTRDGTFLVENGKIAGGVRNFRFNQSIIEMLANVEMLGPAVRSAGEEAFEMVVPAMKVRDFHFSEVTKF